MSLPLYLSIAFDSVDHKVALICLNLAGRNNLALESLDFVFLRDDAEGSIGVVFSCKVVCRR